MDNLFYFIFCCGGVLIYIGLFFSLILIITNILKLILFGRNKGDVNEKVYKKSI